MQFDNSYARLPERFHTHLRPTPVSVPSLIRINESLATELGIDPAWLASLEGIAMMAGNQLPKGTEPIATVYAGHQFGHFNPQLGDGRAILLGEVLNDQNERFDLQLKGSGPTPYSRQGDGRAPLGPVLREYLISEAMAAMGVPTSRTLGAVTSGDVVYREQAEPGAVLTRVAKSHIRIGTFEFFAARQDTAAIRLLTEYVLTRHYPDRAESDNPAFALLTSAIQSQASLVAQWQGLGFIHGVMNTDNMLLSGETIDYGPCAFMDTYHPNTVFSSIDNMGRYQYVNQPPIAHWNLGALGHTLIGQLAQDEKDAMQLAQEAIDQFPAIYESAWYEMMNAKLGVSSNTDRSLSTDFLELLEDQKVDFTLAFRSLCDLAEGSTDVQDALALPDATITQVFDLKEPRFEAWLSRWRNNLDHGQILTMKQHNPLVIPRNHLVEAAIASAVYEEDYEPFHMLLDAVTRPFESNTATPSFILPPRDDQQVTRTFCGT